MPHKHSHVHIDGILERITKTSTTHTNMGDRDRNTITVSTLLISKTLTFVYKQMQNSTATPKKLTWTKYKRTHASECGRKQIYIFIRVTGNAFATR